MSGWAEHQVLRGERDPLRRHVYRPASREHAEHVRGPPRGPACTACWRPRLRPARSSRSRAARRGAAARRRRVPGRGGPRSCGASPKIRSRWGGWGLRLPPRPPKTRLSSAARTQTTPSFRSLDADRPLRLAARVAGRLPSDEATGPRCSCGKI